MKNTPTYFLNRIRAALDWQVEHLDLTNEGFSSGDAGLFEIPLTVFEVQALESLNLRRNSLNSIPQEISKLQNLSHLGLSFNRFELFPDSICQLTRLESLDLSVNELSEVPNDVANLKTLTSLDLSFNRFTTFPESLTRLENLTYLDLSANELSDIPESITRLGKLQTLRLSNNSLTKIPEALYQLPNLEYLELINARDTELSSMVGGHNESSNTRGHNESSNRIREISPNILELSKLRRLELGGNTVEIPPPEVVHKGVDAIKNYFRQLQGEGTDYLFEAKLLIVGEGGAGKTTLAKKIQDPNYVLMDEDSTKGIEVIPWTFFFDGERQFRVNVWDFGGQEIYHSTHQFFLTKRSLYILVADSRKEDTDFYYWLNVVELLSDNSPLLIVQNEKQDRHREINERQLRGQFSNFRETLRVNLATNRGLSTLLDGIKHQVTHLPHIGTPLPKTWVKVREALEKDLRNHITIEEYLDICGQNGFLELEDKLQLIGYLHDLGVCLHFQEDPLLKKTVILKPRWGTDAVYKVLDNKKVINNLGRFNRHDLAEIWSEREFQNMQDELLQLMIKFKLCYQIPNNDFFIAPQLLTENQPDYEWNHESNLAMRYSYEFMPKGIITQFIVAMHKLIQRQNYVWRSGVILEKDDLARAEIVEYRGKREISIRVSGKQSKDLFTIIAYELDRIHESFRRLKFTKLIPCNCDMCSNSYDAHFHNFEVLQRFIADGQQQIQCPRSYRMVEVRGLSDNATGVPKLSIGNRQSFPIKQNGVFISYSRVDKGWLDRLQVMLKPLKRSGEISVWADTEIQPGSKWSDEIKLALVSAKVAVLLVSPSFLASDFIAEYELTPLLAAADREGTRILWIPVSDSMYKETDIAAYQAASDPAEPLDSLSFAEANKTLVRICEQIKEFANL